MVAAVIFLHQLATGAEFPFSLCNELCKLLVLPTDSWMLLFPAAHAHPLFAEGTFRIVLFDEVARDEASTVLPGAVYRVRRMEFLGPKDECFDKLVFKIPVLSDSCHGNGLTATAQFASGFKHGDDSVM